MELQAFWFAIIACIVFYTLFNKLRRIHFPLSIQLLRGNFRIYGQLFKSY